MAENERLTMSSEELMTIYKEGRREFNGVDFVSLRNLVADLTDSKFTNCRFSDAIIARATFNSCEFTNVIFDCCNSIDASYQGTRFVHCHFTPKNAFSHCDFFKAVFENTKMECDFGESFFVSAHFLDCTCMGSVFSKALFGINVIKHTEFVLTTFDDVKVVQACEIDNESVVKSINLIQQIIVMDKAGEARKALNAAYISTTRFFRSLGVDRALLELRSNGVSELTGSNTVFISYNRKDEEFAAQLRVQLETAGIRCWFAPLDMQGGGGVREQIEEAIHRQGRVVLILSENSICSTWVSFEVECALADEKEKGCGRLFPIRICEYEKLLGWKAQNSITGDNLAPVVLDRFVPDFTEWRNITEFGEQVAKLVIAVNDSLK
jgi:hypothetical protein